VPNKREGTQRERERSAAWKRQMHGSRREQKAVAAYVRRCGDGGEKLMAGTGGGKVEESARGAALSRCPRPLWREIGIVFCGDDSMRARILKWKRNYPHLRP
jgi:hypothetical protein